MEDKIITYQAEIQQTELKDQQALEAFRIRYLGAKGVLKQLFEHLKTCTPEEKRRLGRPLNALKQYAENYYRQHKTRLEETASASVASGQDMSLPALPLRIGSRHPIQQVQSKIIRIFTQIGFQLREAQEIEDDWHNFTALNMPEHHPARDMQDTFYLAELPGFLLRTHTSNTQIREMKKKELPLRIICPGKVYRNETISARAHCFFHQIEGLYVAEGVSFADLKQTLYYFAQSLFGKQTKIRLRPSYFPFTEPSAEMDVHCLLCKGKGCGLCKQSGWLEILGCGMVHRSVFENTGIDADRYQGFAFGMGVERITMLGYGIKDIRLFSENDVRFLRQFSGM